MSSQEAILTCRGRHPPVAFAGRSSSRTHSSCDDSEARWKGCWHGRPRTEPGVSRPLLSCASHSAVSYRSPRQGIQYIGDPRHRSRRSRSQRRRRARPSGEHVRPDTPPRHEFAAAAFSCKDWRLETVSHCCQKPRVCAAGVGRSLSGVGRAREVHFTLASLPGQLDTVRVTANDDRQRLPSAGGVGTSISDSSLRRLPTLQSRLCTTSFVWFLKRELDWA